MPLPVSAPFHTSLMRPAGERLAADLESIKLVAPTIPVIHNAHAQPESDAAAIRELLVRQIHSPVLWVDSVRYMTSRGIGTAVEIGPGKVLGGLCKRIDAALECLASEEPADMARALEATTS